MKGHLVRNMFVLQVVLFVTFTFVWMGPVYAETSVNQQMIVSSGVTYQDYRISTPTSKQAARVMKINLKDPYTNIEVGIPNPLNHLSKAVAGSLLKSTPGHQVVGAVNGSFFGPTGLPVYLIANNNQLVNAGKLPIGKTEYANEPIAFGIKDGKGIIDHYNLELRFAHNDVSYPITASNKSRTSNQLILYTPNNPSDYTDTSAKGIEVVVENLDSSLNLSFGSTVTGMVKKIRNYGDESKTHIPENGFVLSATGTSKDALKDIKNGDKISLSVNIDDSWKGSSFMLGSGPMLVDNGKVSLSMDPKCAKAIEKTSRTAVAIDKTGQNVFFITVDGRQPRYSNGMNLTKFAQYLVSLGAYRALNLDGGGSTVMGVRFPGDSILKLANQPSDGVERSVATTLLAISTAPIGQPKYVKVHKSNNEVLLKGSSIKILLDYVRDQYYNPLHASEKDLKITSNLGKVTRTTFTSNKTGKGTITVQYKKISTSIPIEVVDKITSLKVTPTNMVVRKWDVKSLSVKGFDFKKRQILVSPKAVKWSVTGKVGVITKEGVFKVMGTKGTGKITAAYGSKRAAVSVKIGRDQEVLDPFENTTNWTSSAIRASSGIKRSVKGEPVHNGKASLKFNYEFKTSANGTSAAYLNAKKGYLIKSRPNHLGMYVYGDGKKHWLRSILIDGNGNRHTIDFTKDKGLTWARWKYVQVVIPQNWPLPIKIKQIYLAEPHQKLKNKGTLYFDQLETFYSTNK